MGRYFEIAVLIFSLSGRFIISGGSIFHSRIVDGEKDSWNNWSRDGKIEIVSAILVLYLVLSWTKPGTASLRNRRASQWNIWSNRTSLCLSRRFEIEQHPSSPRTVSELIPRIAPEIITLACLWTDAILYICFSFILDIVTSLYSLIGLIYHLYIISCV